MGKPSGLLPLIPIFPKPKPSILHGQSIIPLSIFLPATSAQKRRSYPTRPNQRSMSLNASTASPLPHPPKPEPKPKAPKEWLVHLPDHADPSTLEKRLSVRPNHLSGIKPALASGQLLFGGATLSHHPDDSKAEGNPDASKGAEKPQMTGSVMLVTAESEEEVREFVRGDVYARSGVWDVQNMRVWAFRTAVRRGVEVGEKAW